MNPKHHLGKVCPKHPEDNGLRYVKGNQCVACIKARTEAYQAANPEKVKALGKKWRDANPEYQREKSAANYAVHRDKRKAYFIARYAANRDKMRAAANERRAADPEKARAQDKAWRDANLEKARANQAKYYASKPTKTGLTKAESAKFVGYRNRFMKLTREYFDLMSPSHAEEVRRRVAREALRQKKAVDAAAKAASKAKYEADLLYFKENREAIKRAAMDRHNDARLLPKALEAGFFTVEAYREHRVHPQKKPPEHHAERRRIREQWRGYRKQIKAGLAANGGRIPMGFLDQQWTRQGGCCALCSGVMDKTTFEIDHIHPVARGGANVPDNLQLVHPKCNILKSDHIVGVTIEHHVFVTQCDD